MIKQGTEKYVFLFKSIILIFISGTLLLLPAISFAQGDLPCDDDNPLAQPCSVPLDTYVWLLVIAAIIFGAIHLYRQQKTHSRA